MEEGLKSGGPSPVPVRRLQAPLGAGRVAATAFLLLVSALVVARLALHGGAAWAVLAVALPLVLVFLGVTFGWPLALLGTAFFAFAVLTIRWLLLHGTLGWTILLLAPVIAFTLLLGVRTWRAMRAR